MVGLDMKIGAKLLFAFVLLLAGCGTRILTDRETNPVTEDYIRSDARFGNARYAVLSTRPDRRSVFINVSQHKGNRNFMDICAEPPADVAESFARSQSLAAANNSPSGSSQSLAASRSLSTAVAQLTRRSQGLQFMRDQMFYLCIERLNGTISEAQYSQMRSEVVRLTAAMVNNEIEKLPSNLATVASIANSEARAVIADSEARIVESEANKNASSNSQ